MTIIDDLEKDHARFRKYLIWFHEEVGKLATGETPDYLLLNLLSTYFAEFPDELHHKKEDLVYWRLAEKARTKRVVLINLQDQHEELSKRAHRFADIVMSIINNEQLPIERIVEEAESYRRILSAHMAGEEDALFRPARSLLNKEDWWNIDQAIADLFAADINIQKARSVMALERSLNRYDRES
jgi:hemerythrin-like domain-containing protein